MDRTAVRSSGVGIATPVRWFTERVTVSPDGLERACRKFGGTRISKIAVRPKGGSPAPCSGPSCKRVLPSPEGKTSKRSCAFFGGVAARSSKPGDKTSNQMEASAGCPGSQPVGP